MYTLRKKSNVIHIAGTYIVYLVHILYVQYCTRTYMSPPVAQLEEHMTYMSYILGSYVVM